MDERELPLQIYSRTRCWRNGRC